MCDVPITCPLVLIQDFYSNMHGIDRSVPLFFTHVRGTCILVTSHFFADVLKVPRVEFPDYPSCERLQTMSKDELNQIFVSVLSSGVSASSLTVRPLQKAHGF